MDREVLHDMEILTDENALRCHFVPLVLFRSFVDNLETVWDLQLLVRNKIRQL